MEPILIYPENAEQLKTIKAFLKALKVEFEPQGSTLPPHVRASVEKGLKQIEQGQFISFEEFKARHFSGK